MAKLRLITCMLVVLICLGTTAWSVTWYDNHGNSYEWVNRGTEQNPDWYLRAFISWEAEWGIGEENLLEVGGDPPCLNDPIVEEDIFNETDGWWTDFHVDITNGVIDPGSIVVFNLDAPSPAWVVTPFANGFDAHVVSGADTQVDPFEVLYVKFNYTATGGTVYIRQYPTNDWPIPEPASMVALAMGVGLLGLRIRRRR